MARLACTARREDKWQHNNNVASCGSIPLQTAARLRLGETCSQNRELNIWPLFNLIEAVLSRVIRAKREPHSYKVSTTSTEQGIKALPPTPSHKPAPSENP